MKKILGIILLLFAGSVFATQNTAALKWSASSIVPDDTVTGTTDSIDAGTYSVRGYRRPSTSTGTRTESGNTYVHCNYFWHDSGGTVTEPDSLIFDSTGASLKISSGLTAPTGGGCILRYNGASSTHLENKAVNWRALVIGASAGVTTSGAVTIVFSGTITPLTFINGGTLSIGRTTEFYRTTSGQFVSILAGNPTINGASAITFYANVTGIGNDTLTGWNYTGTGLNNLINLASNQIANTFLGSAFAAGGDVRIYENNRGTATHNFNTLNNDMAITGNFSYGCSGASSKFYMHLGTSHVSAANWNSQTYNSGTDSIFYEASFDTVKGNYTQQSNHVFIPGTSKIILAPTSNATFTTASKLYYDIQKQGTYRTTVSGQLYCHDLTASAGQWVFAAGTDSVQNDYTRTTTDTTWRTGHILRIGRHHVSTGTGPIVNDSGCVEYVGAVNHNLTAGLNRMGCLRVLDNGSLTQLARVYCKVADDSAGTWLTNGYTVMVDSLLKISDSIYTAAADSINDSGSVIIKNTSRPNLKGTLSMIGNAAATITGGGNAKSLGRVIIKKGGNGVTTTGVTKFDTLKILDGTIAMTAATDTVYCSALIDSSTDASTIIAPIVCSGGVTFASGISLTATGVGKIIMTTAGATVALNGASVPTIQLNARASINGGGTIAALSFGLDGLKATAEKAKRLNLTSLSIGGTAAQPDSITSSQAGARDTLAVTDTIGGSFIIDQHVLGGLWLDSTANTGGNNRGVRSLSYTGATLEDTTGAKGDTIRVKAGNGFIGGGAKVGDSLAALTVITSDSAWFIMPQLGAGTYDVLLYNSDLDSLTLGEGFVIPSTASTTRRRMRTWDLDVSVR